MSFAKAMGDLQFEAHCSSILTRQISFVLDQICLMAGKLFSNLVEIGGRLQLKTSKGLWIVARSVVCQKMMVL